MPDSMGRMTAAEYAAHPIRVCQNDFCGKSFLARKRTTGKFCSRACSASVNTREMRASRKKYVDQVLFTSWSPESAYVIGYIVADGHLRHFKWSNWRLTLTSIDRDILVQIASLLGDVRVCSKAQGGRRNPVKGGFYRTSYTLNMCDSVVCRQIEKMGVCPGNKTLRQTLPEMPREVFWHFLRGYTDGDGCVWEDSRGYPFVHWTSGSRVLLEGVRSIVGPVVGSTAKVADRSGTLASLGHTDGRVYVASRLTYGSKKAERVLNLMYRDATICMGRKLSVSSKFLEPSVLQSVSRPYLEGEAHGS